MIVTIDLRIIRYHFFVERSYRQTDWHDSFAQCDYLLQDIHFEDFACYKIEYRGARNGIKWTLWNIWEW